MAKSAKKKSAAESSNIFHNIMQASVSIDKAQVLKMEEYLKSDDTELNALGSSLTSKLSSQQRKDMADRLNLIQKGKFEILDNRIVKK